MPHHVLEKDIWFDYAIWLKPDEKQSHWYGICYASLSSVVWFGLVWFSIETIDLKKWKNPYPVPWQEVKHRQWKESSCSFNLVCVMPTPRKKSSTGKRKF